MAHVEYFFLFCFSRVGRREPPKGLLSTFFFKCGQLDKHWHVVNWSRLEQNESRTTNDFFPRPVITDAQVKTSSFPPFFLQK